MLGAASGFCEGGQSPIKIGPRGRCAGEGSRPPKTKRTVLVFQIKAYKF